MPYVIVDFVLSQFGINAVRKSSGLLHTNEFAMTRLESYRNMSLRDTVCRSNPANYQLFLFN